MKMQEAERSDEWVSALADGQLCGRDFARAIEMLTRDEDARLTWHSYHLVGDVLRCGEALVTARELAFSQRLKLCLAQEQARVPTRDASDLGVSLVPSTAIKGPMPSNEVAANDASFRWKMLAGVASLVAAAAIGWQAWDDLGGAAQVARLPPQDGSRGMVASTQTLAVPSSEAQAMIRDPQLDALLAAHRQSGGSSILQMSAGFLRNATFEGAPR